MNAALVIIFGFLALALLLGILARRGQDMDLEQWTVGGRGFGTVFVFLLLAGEIYTTFIALFVNVVVLVAVSFATGGLAVRREQSA